MKITIPSKVVLGNSEQLIANVLFDVKLPKLKQYHLANGTTVAEVGDSSDVSWKTFYLIKWKLVFCIFFDIFADRRLLCYDFLHTH